jgi:hypothetical protein
MIVTEAELRVSLGLDEAITNREHAVLQTAHSRAEALVVQHLHYNPEQAYHLEFYPRHDHVGGMGYRENDFFDGTWETNGTHAYFRRQLDVPRTLQLRHIPVREVRSLYIDRGAYYGQANRSTFDSTFDLTFQDSASANTLQILGTDYWIELEKEKFGPSGCLLSNSTWPIEEGSIAVEYVSGYSHAELSGRADDDAATADAAIGVVTCPWVNAGGISHAVNLMVLKVMHEQQALKKDSTRGFAGGEAYLSETFQDYSYSRPSGQDGAGTLQLTGLGVGLPTEAIEALEPFMHYGIQRL